MRELADREQIALERSYAYSDSESDLPMLRAVRHAVVVNPDAALRRIALQEGWELVELDRLGRRLKMLALLAAATAAASLGRVVLVSGQRLAGPFAGALQRSCPGRRGSGSARAGRAPRGGGRGRRR